MSATRPNPQMFAIPGRPPEQVALGGRQYSLVRVFKHDFFAATCLYQAEGAGEPVKAVVKFGRVTSFCGLPMAWLGRLTRRREQSIYSVLEGVDGVPRWMGLVGPTGYAVQFLDGKPLDHLDVPPDGFFDRLLRLLEAIHSRGVGYCDANKRSNILVGPEGQAYLVDFQISVRRQDNWPWPLNVVMRSVVAYIADLDVYHVLKHKRRLAPESLSPQEQAISRKRGRLHTIHRKLTKHWRKARRLFLQKQYESGRLVSPTAGLEDHHQPEKATWRKTAKERQR